MKRDFTRAKLPLNDENNIYFHIAFQNR